MYRIKELAIILVLIGFLAYLPSLFGGFVWDDEDFVYANTYVKEFQIGKFWTENAIAGRGKNSNYYRPIQFSMYALIYKVAGPSPIAFHAVGIGLHVITAIMVIIVITIITGSSSVGFLTSLFFLIHPLQTESISYISGHSDPLYAVFFLLSILFFLKRNERMLYKVLSVVFFIIALLSKELALVLPGIAILLCVLSSRPERRDLKDFEIPRQARNDILFVAIFTTIALLYLLSRFTFLQFSDIAVFWKGNPYGEHFVTRLATFFQNFFVYLGLLIYPKDLFMERDFTVKMVTSLWNVWTLLFFILNTGIGIFYFKNRNKEHVRLFFYFWIAFLISLLPYTGVFLLNGIFYEHYMYLPQVFFWAAVFSLSHKLLKNLKFLKLLMFVLLFLFLVRSYVRQYEWIDSERFYRQTLSYAPKSVRIMNGLGMSLAEKENCVEAIQVYKRASALSPRTPNLYHNIANCYLSMQKPDEAEKYYLKALETDPSFTFSCISLKNMGRPKSSCIIPQKY
ncbi:tetratricopeptide repeat protein [Candidatus Roizmanbacteria bacterium]|nr:tetratricopeptide repeat protein [Candidatus Roizmanbacteria bacterium]